MLFWVHLRLDDPLNPSDSYMPPGDYPLEEAEEEEIEDCAHDEVSVLSE